MWSDKKEFSVNKHGVCLPPPRLRMWTLWWLQLHLQVVEVLEHLVE